ncbi:hypothetical protein SBV1_1190007 [Verrucomicrobia bacterium]|nr:hypothetical protein SBV1_1190007 [Verrucomicrobiota bacterium]
MASNDLTPIQKTEAQAKIANGTAENLVRRSKSRRRFYDGADPGCSRNPTVIPKSGPY